MTKEERRLRAQIAANTRWAKERNRTLATAKARQAFRDRFAHEVDPDGVMSEQERERRAESLRKAHYMRMSVRSAKARHRG